MFLLVVVLLVWPPSALTQVIIEIGAIVHTNSLSGQVVDQGDIALPEALVERLDRKTKEVMDSAKTDDKGKFQLKDAPEGMYTLRVSRAGFRTTVYENVSVLKKYKKNLTIKLSIGF